jgi:hypothetical protein
MCIIYRYFFLKNIAPDTGYVPDCQQSYYFQLQK